MLTDFSLKWDKFIVNFIDKGGYKQVVDGLENTILVAVVGLVIGMLIGVVIAVISVMPKYPILPYAIQNRFDRFLDRFPKKPLLRVVSFYYFFYAIMWILQRIPFILQKICSLYVALFRGTPVMVQLLMGYFVLLPSMGLKVTAVQASMLIFGLNSGAYVSEIMRGGINSVDAGQLEAARAVGFSYSASMIKIVVPQAIKNILPALANEVVSMVKESSICSTMGMMELMWSAKTVATTTHITMGPYFLVAILYFAINYPASKGIEALERRMRRGDRQ